MKWLAFTAACVVALVSLGVLAVDEPDVEWEGRQPLCPYCRAKVEMFAIACRECDRTFDWESIREPCSWCLAPDEVELLQSRLRDLALVEGAPLPKALADYPRAYLYAIEPGACTFCGGLGTALVGEQETPCAVCRGSTFCIGCAGRRTMTVGDRGAYTALLERRRRREVARARAKLTGQPVNRAELLDSDVAALSGHRHAEQIRDESGRALLERARERITGAFAALEALLAERDALAGAQEPKTGS